MYTNIIEKELSDGGKVFSVIIRDEVLNEVIIYCDDQDEACQLMYKLDKLFNEHSV